MNRSSNKRTRRSSSRSKRSSRSRKRSHIRVRRSKRTRRSSKRSKKGGWGATATATKDNKPFFPSLLSGGWGGAPELGF